MLLLKTFSKLVRFLWIEIPGNWSIDSGFHDERLPGSCWDHWFKPLILVTDLNLWFLFTQTSDSCWALLLWISAPWWLIYLDIVHKEAHHFYPYLVQSFFPREMCWWHKDAFSTLHIINGEPIFYKLIRRCEGSSTSCPYKWRNFSSATTFLWRQGF